MLAFGDVLDVRELPALAEDVALDGFDLVGPGHIVMGPFGVQAEIDHRPLARRRNMGRQAEQFQFPLLDFQLALEDEFGVGQKAGRGVTCPYTFPLSGFTPGFGRRIGIR